MGWSEQIRSPIGQGLETHGPLAEFIVEQLDRGKGAPREGAEQRVIMQVRPTQLAFNEWKPALYYIDLVLIPRENGEIAKGQGLLPAEKALWD